MKTSEFRKLIREEVKKILIEGTRSMVGIELPGGKVSSIYVQYDGYLAGVGKKLKNKYKDPNIVKKLINIGDVKSIEDSIELTEPGKFNKKGKTVPGDEFIEYAYKNGAEYMYLFKDGNWLYSKSGKPWKKV